MIDSEVTSTVAAAGGQYTQAKHMIGPLMAFNVGLFLVLEYTMLEAADANVMSYLATTVASHLGYTGSVNQYAFIVLAIMVLAFLNYRGVLATLSVNFVITGVAFVAILVLFFGMRGLGRRRARCTSAGSPASPTTGCRTAGSACSPPCSSACGTTSASRGRARRRRSAARPRGRSRSAR